MSIFNNIKSLLGNSEQNASANQQSTTEIPSNAKKVMVVEDEKMLAEAIMVKLRNSGFETIYAENGQVALDMAISQKPNLILLDILMPVMDGKVMLRKLRDIPEFKNIPVLVLTNAGDVDTMREMQSYYSASGFLIKTNVNPDDIVNKIKELLS